VGRVIWLALATPPALGTPREGLVLVYNCLHVCRIVQVLASQLDLLVVKMDDLTLEEVRHRATGGNKRRLGRRMDINRLGRRTWIRRYDVLSCVGGTRCGRSTGLCR
jgi:hypothetical protein